MEEEKTGFFLTVIPKPLADTAGKYAVFSGGEGVDEEVVLALVRQWLRSAEDAYNKRFMGAT
ncbi:MAG: hypothetical protein Q7K43_03565 [Candidatus Woesearchaeota archaeon]|nr:hypothetical protein [Candidatus Woesearchaeota archaeon]